ncbi:MAG TPA: hypothetical protein PLO23_05920 [Alphaproteobacteria bacterium]|nr:hypothetical protein [Alphaproteobacteria bacterium]
MAGRYLDDSRISALIGAAGEVFLLGGAAAGSHTPRMLAAGLGLAGYGHLLLRKGDLSQRWADAGKLWIAQFGVLLASGIMASPHDFVIGTAGAVSYLILNAPKPTEGLKSIWNKALSAIDRQGAVELAGKIVIAGSALYAALCFAPLYAPALAEYLGLTGGVDGTGIGLAAAWIAASLYQIKAGRAMRANPPANDL